MELLFYICVLYVVFSLFTEVRFRTVNYHWTRYPYWVYRVYYRYPFRSRAVFVAAIIFAVLYQIQKERSFLEKLSDLIF